MIPVWCAGEDSNLHVLTDTGTSSQPGYRLQHPRVFITYNPQLLKLSRFSYVYGINKLLPHYNIILTIISTIRILRILIGR